MTDTLPAAGGRIDKADQLPAGVRAPLRDLVLVLADSKRVLGLRYSERMLGAPTLEAGISASSMAQDEWGHARLTYALLSEFGDDPKALEHERPAAAYRSMPALDRRFESWSDLVAASLLADTALSVQYAALADSRYTPVRNRVQKLLDEERFHFQYAAGWTRRIAAAEAVRGGLGEALARMLPHVLLWFGRGDLAGAARLVEEGFVAEGPDALRVRLLSRVAPVLAEAGLAEVAGLAHRAGGWEHVRELDWVGWDEATRREGGALDEETAARARGDKNRALLLD
ncbi:MAG TPA: Phenylacetic acid catabolic protein [Longimicrobiaceae bacterium]|nr:Phenylacetic acid catabolic protein [Longimicrobiaceae bacterium]